MRKRLILVLIGILLFGSDVLFQSLDWPVVRMQAAAVLLTQIGIEDGDANGTETSSTFDTTGATLIVVCQGNYTTGSGTAQPNAPTDNQSNSYTALTFYATGTFNPGARCYYKLNPTTNASHTVMITDGASGALFECAHVSVYSGIASFDQETGGGNTLTPGSLTPAENNELGITFAAFGDNNGSIDISSISDGYTLISNRIVDGPVFGCGSGYQVQTTATARNPTVTLSAGGEGFASTQFFFKATSSAPGGSFLLLGVGH